MHRELQNMSEESLQNLEEIVEMELLTVEDIRNRLDVTEKGKIRQLVFEHKAMYRFSGHIDKALPILLY